MYAIIETGGKQYRVEQGDTIDVELVDHKDQKVSFNEVLFCFDGNLPRIGSPHVDKCIVHAEVIGQTKGPKVIAFKYKRRKNYRKKIGHRQKYTKVKITEIAIGG